MNKIPATVTQIENVDSLHIVSFDFHGEVLKMMSLELNNIEVGTRVNLLIKPTHVGIGKNVQGKTSFSNALRGNLVDMERGKLLANIKLKVYDILLESIITMESFRDMDLQLTDELTIFIKSSDIAIAEVIEDEK